MKYLVLILLLSGCSFNKTLYICSAEYTDCNAYAKFESLSDCNTINNLMMCGYDPTLEMITCTKRKSVLSASYCQ